MVLQKLISSLSVPKNMLLLLTAGAFALILAAFVLEYGFDAAPCQMCWWQRYVHWALAAVGLVAIFLQQVRYGLMVMAGLGVIGVYLAVWQVLVQYGFLPAPEGCSSQDVLAATGEDLLRSLQTDVFTMPACDQIDFTIFGITLAGWNILVMASFVGVSVYVLIKGDK